MPPDPPDQPIEDRWHWPASRRWATTIGLLLLATIVPLLRQRGAPSWDTIFSEDGAVYLEQSAREGPFTSMFRGYSGYLQLPSRLLGSLSTIVPIGSMALFLSVSATFVVALLAWFVFHHARGWIRSPVIRLVLAAFVVVAPLMLVENTANITNLIWTFAAVAPWALVSLDERARDTATRAVVVVLAAGATPLCVVYLPLAIGWLIYRRTRSAAIVAGAFVVGLAIQFAVIQSTTRASSSHTANSVQGMFEAAGVRVFGITLFGPRLMNPLWSLSWRAVIYGAPVIVLVALGLLTIGVRQRTAVIAWTFAALSILMFVVPVWGRGLNSVFIFLNQPLGMAGYRYSVIPSFLLISAIAVAIGGERIRDEQVVRVVKPVLAVTAILLIVFSFSGTNSRSGWLRWRSGVAYTYEHDCGGAPSSKEATVQAAAFYPVTLTCDRLAR